MKYIYILLFCLAMTKSEANKSDIKGNINEIADLIETSFSLGNAKLLESLLSKELELVIDSEKVEFAKIHKERAGFILSAFFKRNPPIEFDYVYQGNTSETLRYSVGNYKSSNKEFLIYMLIKENSDHTFGIKTLQMREN
jgi:hypothetical protein